MSTNQNATIRYQALNNCLENLVLAVDNEEYYKTKVLPHLPDLPEGQAVAWMDLDKTRIGYEINFTKLHRGDKYLLFNFKKPMREEGILVYTIPEMPNHPDQTYTAKTIVQDIKTH